MPIVITGFTSDDKVPGAVSEVKYGQSASRVSDIPRLCVITGMQLAAGSVAVGVAKQVFSLDDAMDFWGEGSEAAFMAEAALEVPGVNLWGIGTEEPAGGTVATAHYVLGGTWSTAGVLVLHVGGVIKEVAIASDDDLESAGDKVVAAIAEIPNLFCVPTHPGDDGDVILTTRNKGARSNLHIIHVDLTRAPAGLTCSITGGTALANGGKPFTGGGGVDDVADFTTTAFPGWYQYIGSAHNDATNAALLETYLNDKAAPFEQRPEFAVLAHNVYATGLSVAQTTLNDPFCEMMMFEGSRAHPSRIAAVFAALRSVTEAQDRTVLGNPNARYKDTKLPGILGYFSTADKPTRAELKVMLNSGLTPISDKNGEAVVVRAITTRCLNGSTPDYRVLDVGQAVTPQRVREHFDLKWETIHSVANEYVGPDKPGGEQAPEGMSTPKTWGAEILIDLREFERANLITDVDNNLPTVEYSAAKRLMSDIPVSVAPLNYQTGTLIRQVG
jgi:phage tail sheath gpL-like